MNLDGDGRNQTSTSSAADQRRNGGEVDCWSTSRGHQQGQITPATRFVVIGDPPEKSSTEFVKNYGDILRDAERYQVHKMTLSDFKQQMDYKKSSSVEHFAGGASTSNIGQAALATKAGKAAKAAAKSADSGN